jgi:hypothetical protein
VRKTVGVDRLLKRPDGKVQRAPRGTSAEEILHDWRGGFEGACIVAADLVRFFVVTVGTDVARPPFASPILIL